MKKVYFLHIICLVLLLSCSQEGLVLEVKRETLDVADVDVTNTTAIVRGNIEFIGATIEDDKITKKGILWTTEKDNLHYSLVTGYLRYTSGTSSGSGSLAQLQANKIYYTENFNIIFSQTEGQGSFSCKLTELQPNTKYYVKAFAVVSTYGRPSSTYIVCGQQKEFTTSNSEAIETSNFIRIGDLYVQTKDIGDNSVTWDRAYELCDCDVIGDFNDWRLPTYNELTTIYNRKLEIGGFSINNPQYWSGTRDDRYYSKYYFYIDIVTGTMSSSNTGGRRVRCVRKDIRLIDTIGNLLVLHNDRDEKKAWQDAYNECRTLSIGGYWDWRLPTVEEFKMITANQNLTGMLQHDYYWTSDTVRYNSIYKDFYAMKPSDINPTESNQYYRYNIRCVRTLE